MVTVSTSGYRCSAGQKASARPHSYIDFRFMNEKPTVTCNMSETTARQMLPVKSKRKYKTFKVIADLGKTTSHDHTFIGDCG